MSYNTRQLRREGKPPSGQLASPVPQYWNPSIEDFEDVTGKHGAPYAMLVGPNGQPISASNRLPVADADALNKLEQVRALLESIDGFDFATNTKLEQARALLETISDVDFATQTTLEEVLQRLEDIEERLTDGAAKVQLTGRFVPPEPSESLAIGRQGPLAGGSTSEVILDVPGKMVELQSFSLGSSSPAIQVRLSFYDKHGVIDGHLRIARADGTGLLDPTVDYVQTHSGGGNDFWRVVVYDTQKEAYSLAMQRPLKALNGMRITITNHRPQPYDVAVNASISVWEKGGD